MTGAGKTLWACGTLLLAGSLAVVALHRADAPALPQPALPAKPTGPRVSFPPGRYPALALPGGGSLIVHSLLNVPERMRYGQYVWNEEGVPAGPVKVRVDLAKQLLSVFRDGHEIGTTVILYGMDGMATPSGMFPILEKAVVHRSSTYDADMPYMLRLTNDGIAIHASNVRIGYATHGCIGIPEAFAQLLYGQVKRGDPVAILPA